MQYKWEKITRDEYHEILERLGNEKVVFSSETDCHGEYHDGVSYEK